MCSFIGCGIQFLNNIEENNVTVLRNCCCRVFSGKHLKKSMKTRDSVILCCISNKESKISRRKLLSNSVSFSLLVNQSSAQAYAVTTSSLRTRLDSKSVEKIVFNSIPKPIQYPIYLLGTWNVSELFTGFEIPLLSSQNTTITKQEIIKNIELPGFQKCSIAAFADIGKIMDSSYQMRFNLPSQMKNSDCCYKDLKFCVESSINSHLNGSVIDSIFERNANQTSIDFKRGSTLNAEHIELFRNRVEVESDSRTDWFFVLEQWRQVTTGYSTSFGRARSVNTDYTHVWGFRPELKNESGDVQSVDAFCSTFAFVNERQTPALYEKVANKPVILYQHRLKLEKA